MPDETQITRDRYKERVSLALQYIHDNLCESIDLNDVAKASHFSAFHFHRIFHGLMDETLNDYIRRRRLEFAVNMLVYDEGKSVTEIALSCGFSSSSNFSKAFTAYFGCSPSAVRNPHKFKENSKIGELKRKHGKDFDPTKFYPEFIHQTKEIDMDVQIIDQKEKRVAFLVSPKGYDKKAIFQTWDKLCEWAGNMKVGHGDHFGLCYDNPAVTPLAKCRYEACIEIGHDVVVSKPFEEAVIPAGRYAMAYYRGASDPDSKLHMKLYGEWLPQSGFEPDDYPLLERYLNDEREDGFVEMQVLIKLQD